MGLMTPANVSGAVVLELPRSGASMVLAEHWFDYMLGEGFYEPRNATLFMFSDKMDGIHRARLPGFEPAPTIPITFFTPGRCVTTPSRERASRVAIASPPRSGANRSRPKLQRRQRVAHRELSLSFGSDWDEAARKVYVAVPNLGLLVRSTTRQRSGRKALVRRFSACVPSP
jgi:hypothetical protein